MRRLAALLVALALAPLGPTGEATAQATTMANPMIEAIFDAIERRIIEDFFGYRAREAADQDDHATGNGKHGKGLPPGLAKRSDLPPGLAMQLERNGTLPPGLAKRDLPPELEARLRPLPAGLRRVIVGSDVVLVNEVTNTVLDIIRNVLVHAGS